MLYLYKLCSIVEQKRKSEERKKEAIDLQSL